MKNIKIIQAPDKKHPYVILYKSEGLPSAPLHKDDKITAINFAIEQFPELAMVKGKKEIEYGLIHRIDTPTKGLLLIAATQNAYNFFSDIQKKNLFEKKYRAKSVLANNNDISFPDPDINISERLHNFQKYADLSNPIVLKSFFRHFGPSRKLVRPVTQKSSRKIINKAGTKEYETRINITNITDNYIETVSSITAGFRHQVRCHLAWIGLPIIGDSLYNQKMKKNEAFQFEACYLKFPDPITDSFIEYSV